MSHVRSAAVRALALTLAACTPARDDTGGPDARGAWQVEQQALPGAVLSIWGSSSSDVWLSAAAGGPRALHGTPQGWTELSPPGDGALWWVAGAGDAVWFAGDGGVVLRYDRGAGAFTTISTPTDATLYGIWALDEERAWAVGGFVTTGPAVVLSIEGDVATLVEELPLGGDPAETWFKVWGAGPDDLWVIGDRGTVLHRTAARWSRQLLPGGPRLVTLRGNAAGELLVVGGSSSGVMFGRQTGSSAWQDVSPGGLPPLNGVFLTEGGDAAAAGFQRRVMRREGGAWSTLPTPDVRADWHATWIDERGHTWVAGGDLFALTGGAVLRYDPDAPAPEPR